MHAVFTISHATIDYGAFNRTNFNIAMDHLTRLLIIRGKNPLYGNNKIVMHIASYYIDNDTMQWQRKVIILGGLNFKAQKLIY